MKKMPVIAGTIVVVGIVVGIFIAVPITTSASSYPVLEVSDGQVYAIGETATINITLSEAPNGLSGYNLSISLSNASVAEIISVSFPNWATLHSNSSLPADSIWIKAVDLNDKIKRGDKNITLAILKIRGDNYGGTEIAATVTKMDDDDGNPIDPLVKHGNFDPSTSTSLPVIYFYPQSTKTDVGSEVTVNLVLDKAPDGLSGYNLTVSLSNPEVAEIVSVSFPKWATLHSSSSLPADSVWIKCVDLNDEIKRGDKNISLARLTLRGNEKGKTDLVITVTKIDDDVGNPIDVSTTKGYLEVARTATEEPSVSISTDKYEYTAGDVMLINITIKNPGERKGVKFLFCLDITDYDKHFTIINNRSLLLPAFYDKTFTLRLKLPELKSSFNASWHVAIFNKTTSELISEDHADWKYAAAKARKTEGVEGLEKSVREIIPF